jgi:hypothetical protein
MPTGDEVEAGYGTSANAPTVLMASVDDDGNSNFPPGRAVFEAGPTDVLGQVPQDAFIGVVGRGSHGHTGSNPSSEIPAMPGVFGFGGRPGGPGAGVQGGSGVIGTGGDAHSGDPKAPGPGVLGIGGRAFALDLTGAGVVGISGSHTGATPIPELPPFSETQNVGVFGIAAATMFNTNPTTVGVRGQSDSGIGVHGVATGIGRGGVFHSKHSAQVQLAPYDLQSSLPAPTPIQAEAIPTERDSGPALPEKGQSGDLMAVLDDQRNCTLWFCVRGHDGKQVARWAQVLLGPAFDGRD